MCNGGFVVSIMVLNGIMNKFNDNMRNTTQSHEARIKLFNNLSVVEVYR